jgi:large subunit ribosomal protein L6
MSRLAKRPIPLSQGVEVNIQGSKVTVKGPKGTLERDLPADVRLEVEDKLLWVKPANEKTESRILGLYWALTSNMVQGVSVGFTKELTLIGVGYRAAVQGQEIELQLGYSNPIKMAIPEGISAKVEKNTALTLTGIDKQKVGQFAADVRALRKPEPYKGKGVRYKDEYVRRKAGKAAKK